MFGQMAKWVAQIDRAERMPEYVSRAFHIATQGGRARWCSRCRKTCCPRRPRSPTRRASAGAACAVAGADCSNCERLLERRKRPFVIVGGGGWNRDARTKLQSFAEAHGLPVGTAFRFQDLFDNRSPNYAGDVGIGINPKLAQRVKEADVLLAIGARLGEMTTSGYTLLEAPLPQPDADPRARRRRGAGRVYRPALVINSGYAAVRRCSRALAFDKPAWKERTAGRARGVPGSGPNRAPMPGKLQYGEVIRWLSRQPARGRDHHQRRRQLRRLAAPLLPLQGLPHAARLDHRLDGLRLAGGGRGQARRAEAHRARARAATATS